jgi:hypothetical protein
LGRREADNTMRHSFVTLECETLKEGDYVKFRYHKIMCIGKIKKPIKSFSMQNQYYFEIELAGDNQNYFATEIFNPTKKEIEQYKREELEKAI